MTDPVSSVERPSPAAALQRTFEIVWRERMHRLPMLNPALAVEAVGFRAWRDHWLGILVTPWFMNLVLMPRVDAAWQAIGERESRHHVFPAGVFEFIGAREPTLGDYQACSLFSPMFEFADQGEARAIALASLDALFDVATRDAPSVPPPEAPAAAVPRGPVPTLTKRGFLFGATPRADRGP